MKISKHLHSCLLIQDKEHTILIDPGIYTYQEKALDIHKLKRLDYILITHEHPDHFHVPFIKALIKQFPSVTIISNRSVVNLLKNEGVKAIVMGTEKILLEESPHEQLWDKKPPANVMFHIDGLLTHPGDSHHFAKTNDILALPITAPWGSTADAVILALKRKPKVIIPIHDWMLKDVVRKGMYHRLQGFFKEKGIDFKGLETGESITI